MVIMLIKANHVFLTLWTVILFSFEVEISVAKANDFCQNNLCLNKSQSNSKIKSDLNVEFNNLSKKEIYYVASAEVPFNVSFDENNYLQIHQEATSKQHIYFTETTERNNKSIDQTVQLYNNNTSVTEINELTTEDVFTLATQTHSAKKMSAVTTKLGISTASPPFSAHYPVAPRYSKSSRKVCFCDMQTNQCDMNCCCDEDCNPAHFKLFTNCYDIDNATYDSKYCYKNNFLFGNNTSYQTLENNGGLFCIIKENLKVDLNYEAKALFTTLEAFNKCLTSDSYSFFYKTPKKLVLITENYIAGSPVWSIQNNELVPFKVPYSSVGFLCNSEVNIKYLVDEVKTCFYQQQSETSCDGSKIKNLLHYLKETKIISNPFFLNQSLLLNSSEICRESKCIGITSYLCELVDDFSNCTKISEISEDSPYIDCWSALGHVQYQIWHNGSEGILKMDSYLWVKKLPRLLDEFLSQIITEISYTWIGSTKKVFRKSGNPGYLTGKPILAGRKVYNIVNGTADKKEAIELSIDPKNWLSVLGSEKGICSSKERITVNFRENSRFMCSLNLTKSNFSKEKCMELQSNIFKLLVGNEVINETKENYFNKFVATFGNSRVEETGDWVQILIDLFPISSSPVSFKSNYHHLLCKNIITDLYINIIYSKIGSFLSPQSKILGVSFQFGKHKDLIYYCNTSGCENTSLVQYIKLSSAVRFVDVTTPAIDAFAEPLSLETKLPHDFFYPFFSRGVRYQFLNKFVLFYFFFCVILMSRTKPQ